MKIKKRCPNSRKNNAQIALIYGLNFSFESCFKSISDKKLQHFTIQGLSFMCCRWIPKGLPCPEIPYLHKGIILNNWRKTSYLIYVCLTRVLFHLKPSSLKLEKKNGHKRTVKEIGSCTSKPNNVIFMCTTASSSKNVKSMYQFSFKNLIFFSFLNFNFGQTSVSIGQACWLIVSVSQFFLWSCILLLQFVSFHLGMA